MIMKEDTIMEILIRLKPKFETLLELIKETHQMAESVNEILENEDREPTEEEQKIIDEIEEIYDEITDLL